MSCPPAEKVEESAVGYTTPPPTSDGEVASDEEAAYVTLRRQYMAAATEEHLEHMRATAPELGTPHAEGSYSPLDLGESEAEVSHGEEEESPLPTPYEIFDLTADDSSQDNDKSQGPAATTTLPEG